MIALLIVVVITVGVVCSIGILCYSDFKNKEIEYQRKQAETVATVSDNDTKIEIEKERTKQLHIKADYREKYKDNIPEKDYELEILKEKTKQLEIKERCFKEHGERLYV